jgi:hypothetical protein
MRCGTDRHPLPSAYTDRVGCCRIRIISFVMLTALAGAAPAAFVCEALCSVPVDAAAPRHHEPGLPHQVESDATAAGEASAAHEHHGSAVRHAGPSREVHLRVVVGSTRDCCSDVGDTTSLTAGRVDSRIEPVRPAVHVVPTAVPSALSSNAAGLPRGLAPGRSSPAQTALVLRI